MVKQIISSALALSMVFGAAAYLPQDIFSADTAIVASAKTAKSGKCGEHVKWTLDSNGTLTISGTGEMYDYSSQGSGVARNMDYDDINAVKKIVIKKGVTNIAKHSFSEFKNVRSVVMADTVTSIGYAAFWYCEKLSKIKFSKNLTDIQPYAFENTKWLKNKQKKDPLVVVNGILIDGKTAKGKVTIPSTVKKINEHAFEYNKDITSVTIPGSVKTIGECAFTGCENLKTVKMKKGVKTIEDAAFSGNTNLKTVKVPSSVRTIGGDAFSGTKYLTSLANKRKDKLAIVNNIVVDGRNCKGKITIPKGVKKISPLAFFCFDDKSKLTSVTIPNGVTEIGTAAFLGCLKLKTIKIPKSVTSFGKGTGHGGNGGPMMVQMFNGTKWLKARQKKNPLVIINGILVDGTTAKGKVTIPKNVKEIAHDAFSGNMDITSVVIPGNVKKIDENAFDFCWGLKKVTIKNGVETIGDAAFVDDPYIESIIVPASVKTIGDHAIGYSVYNDSYGKNEPVISCTKGSAALKYAKANGFDHVTAQKFATVTVKDQKYTGKALKPAVTVKVGKTKLKKGKDYTVSYTNNKNLGTAFVTVKLKVITPASSRQDLK